MTVLRLPMSAVWLAAALSLAHPAAAQSCERASRLAFTASLGPSGSTAELDALLDAGVGVDCYSTGKTALMHAARWNSPAAVALLLRRGADPTLRSTDDGWTALQYATSEGYPEVTRLLAAHLGVPDPLAPASSTPPTPAGPAPIAPAAPAPLSTPRPPHPGPGWAPFGTFRVGDRVQVWTSAGWRSGSVTDVGNATGDGSFQSRVYERKYRVADDRFTGDGDWYDWGLVVGPEREPYWTSFFMGTWTLGETMAVNTRVEGRTETTEVAYGSATETLRVRPDGTYVWSGRGRRPIRGRWTPAPDAPGIVLLRGPDGRDWTMANQSNATEETIRSIETARLFAQGQMSVAAKRPLPTTPSR